jgi:type VI secretion system secreted protein Hcp
LHSWSWGETQTGTFASGTGGGGAGKVQMQDIQFVTETSKASPKLFLFCASGEHIKKAVLTCRKAGKDQQDFLKYTLSDCLLSSYHTGGSTASGLIPQDQFSINFAKIEIEYKPQKPDGTLDSAVPAGWDLPKNVKA